ncbi:YcxB-like protein [Natronincola peptidivorans]|uniref:YcxB-like protein n=1 Tax=Natronincola peptidivorans TaxID=426128 RepID=A0A1I0FLA5_9FIRM|nr:YcxB family protein [Natronincola peptidivorans]SET59066.1 YcxB-like protein [Natronincola peptidivorans]
MSVLLENKTVIKEDVLTEFIQETFKIYEKKIRIIAIGGIALPSIILASMGDFLPFTILTAIFGVFLFFKGHLFKKNKIIKNFYGLHGDSPQATYTFYEDKLKSTVGQSNLSINYEQITNLLETKNLYIVMIERQGLMIKKDGFTVGNEHEFKSFLIDKCPNIRKK